MNILNKGTERSLFYLEKICYIRDYGKETISEDD